MRIVIYKGNQDRTCHQWQLVIHWLLPLATVLHSQSKSRIVTLFVIHQVLWNWHLDAWKCLTETACYLISVCFVQHNCVVCKRGEVIDCFIHMPYFTLEFISWLSSPEPLSSFLTPLSLICLALKVLWNANACWLVLIYNTLIITNVAKRLFKYVPYILLWFFC